jgi:glutaredoxin
LAEEVTMSDKALIMYSRTIPCPDCERARQLLEAHAVPFREVMIDQDPAAQSFVEALTGYRSVPTLVVARPDASEPLGEPRPLERGRSPRGIDRGPVITEPDMVGLRRWLEKHGFIAG